MNRLWAALLAVYDEPGGWVALILRDVSGRHPDTTNPAHAEQRLAATDALTDELAGRATGLDIATSGEVVQRWTELWPAVDELPSDVLPSWVRDLAPSLELRHEELVEASAGDNLVHADILNGRRLGRLADRAAGVGGAAGVRRPGAHVACAEGAR